MLSFHSKASLHLPPQRVWALFQDMQRNYLAWHPAHLGWEDLRGLATEPGAVVFAEERVGWLLLRTRFFIEEAVTERRFVFRLGFPFSLAHAGGSFELTPAADGGCLLDAETHFGARSRFWSRLVDPLLRKVLPLGKLERHMREEVEGFERLASRPAVAEKGAPHASRAVTARVRFFVNRPPREVFDFFADLRNEPEYNGQVRDIVKTSEGPIGLDTTFAGRHTGFGRVTWRLAEYDPPRRVVIDGVVGRGRYRWVADLESEGTGTVFTGRMAWEPPRSARALGPVLRLALWWNARRSFRRFKAVVEKRAGGQRA